MNNAFRHPKVNNPYNVLPGAWQQPHYIDEVPSIAQSAPQISVQPDTELVFIIDKSGSMGLIRTDAIGGFNTFLEDQKKIDSPASATLALFNSSYNKVYENVNLSDVPALNEETFAPAGGTAMYDAIVETITAVMTRQALTAIELRPKKTMVVILTDGEENASHNYGQKEAFNLINYVTEKLNWEFLFLAANQDAMKAAASISIKAKSAMNFAATADGMETMYSNMTRSVASYRTSM